MKHQQSQVAQLVLVASSAPSSEADTPPNGGEERGVGAEAGAGAEEGAEMIVSSSTSMAGSALVRGGSKGTMVSLFFCCLFWWEGV